MQAMAEKKAIPMDESQRTLNSLTLEMNEGETSVPTVIRMGTGKMNAPNDLGTLQKAPQSRGRG
jgi:hypothetical protein